MRAAPLYAQPGFLVEQKKQVERDLLREAKKHPIVRILETAPGFGPIRSARLVPIVVTPHRFRTKRQFWSDRSHTSISANGAFMVLDSAASDLVPGDTNASTDVFGAIPEPEVARAVCFE